MTADFLPHENLTDRFRAHHEADQRSEAFLRAAERRRAAIKRLARIRSQRRGLQ